MVTDRRKAVCAWLTANGINPDLVPVEADMNVTTDDACVRQLRCEVYVSDADGRPVHNERQDAVAIDTVTVPLLVEPPTWWQPYIKPTREQLLEALDAVRQLHRPADHAGQSICVECSAYDGWATTDNTPVPYPCDTIRALHMLPDVEQVQ